MSIIVLSSNVEIIEKISEALTEVHAKGSHKWKLAVLRALRLEEVVKQTKVTGNVALDFVVLALDTKRVFCIEWAKRIMMQVHPDLRKRRLVLVNASGLPVNSMAVDAGELLSLQDEFNVDLLSANVYKPEDAAFLAKRLLKYLEVTIGMKTGIPNLNV